MAIKVWAEHENPTSCLSGVTNYSLYLLFGSILFHCITKANGYGAVGDGVVMMMMLMMMINNNKIIINNIIINNNNILSSFNIVTTAIYRFPTQLTHWGRDKMDAIFQTTFSNGFSWMKMYEFRFKISLKFVPRVQLTIFQHWFREWLGADQATSHYLNQSWYLYRRIYASLGLNELIH